MIDIPSRFSLHTNAFADFWNSEDGREMLNLLPATPKLDLAKESIPLLFAKDDLADEVIDDIFLGKPFGEALQFATDCIANGTGESASLRELARQMTTVPDWVNTDLLDLGRKVCQRSGKSGLIVLRNYSLMLGYQSAAINKPLIATGALHSGAVKRIADTTNFWYAVTGTNALQRGNEGFNYCVRTRLVHAYSRVMIKQKLDWSIDQQGEPLNFWDMVATYLGFSLVFMRGLQNLGISVTEDESDAVYHLWKYIGYLIGIPPEIMPDNNLAAIKSLYLWSKTQPEADADSIALAHALHLEPLKAPWPARLSQKKFIQQVNLSFNYHLIGSRSCKILQLPEPKSKWIAKAVRNVNRIDDALGKMQWYRVLQIRRGRADQLVIRNRVNMQQS
ncbi:MAG: DUF2236 domain-containing protein [Flavobacterium sp.]|nr:DUF2236 domain-containing protein [Flavobacterium sp.]